MNNSKSSTTSSVGFFALLQIAFIILKVADVIKWNWWKVFIPTYISVGLAILVIAVIAILEVAENIEQKRGEYVGLFGVAICPCGGRPKCSSDPLTKKWYIRRAAHFYKCDRCGRRTRDCRSPEKAEKLWKHGKVYEEGKK